MPSEQNFWSGKQAQKAASWAVLRSLRKIIDPPFIPLEDELKGRVASFNVPAAYYAAMAWATEHIGAEGLLYPGTSLRDHARFAIRALSHDVEKRVIYSHIGWREIDGEMVYLHAGGHIGRDGQVSAGETQLQDSLARYVLPDPPEGDEAAEARLVQTGHEGVVLIVIDTGILGEGSADL
jgi:hypothetical protein